MWVKIVDGVELRCVKSSKSNKPFKYEKRVNDEVLVIDSSNNSPTEMTHRSNLYADIIKYLTDYSKEKQKEIFTQIKNQLENNIVDEDKVKENEALQQSREAEKRRDEKYTDLYARFNGFLEKYDKTPLEMIVAVTHCLGVGSPREIVRAFLGYFQTIAGFKGTNVIAIGSPASGKSFILETALSLIPDENVHKGGKSVAYFFRKYNHRDLTGEIFFIGDLGGEKSNEDTIQLRDLIKELTTDGYVERGVVNKDNNMEEEEQWVKGFPALSYTSAKEEMVNEQEKSRSVILTPQPVDSGKLMVFDTIMNYHGKYYDDINEIMEIKESIKGLVYKFNPDDFDFFNPYMFSIEGMVKENDDFNRKIQEFNAILKLVTILNHPNSLTHQLYYDDMYEQKDTKIYLASKRDNITALNIFDSANLLPDEIRFANGLLECYDVFDIGIVDEESLWEDQVYDYLKDDPTIIDEDNGQINISDVTIKDKVFTTKSLKSTHRTKAWFKKSKNYINDRIKVMLDENIIVNIGKDSKNNHNVYCLNQGLGDTVEDTLPQFRADDIHRATNLFAMIYPDNVDEYKRFIDEDKDNETASIFECVKPIKENLPYLEVNYHDL